MKLFWASLFVLFSTQFVFAQSATNNAAAQPDTAGDAGKFSVLQAGLSYGNTTNYYGQTTAEKLGYASADIAYKNKTGLWAAASAVKLVDISQAISEIDVSAGYDFDLTKKLSGAVSYTRFFFAKDSPLPQSVNPNTASLGLNYDFKWWNSSLYGDYVFGNLKDDQGNSVKDFYLTFSSLKTINLGSIVKDKDYITLEPSVSFVGGTQRVGTYETKQVGTVKPKNRLRLPLPTPERPVYETTYVESSKLSLVTSGFRLPLAYNRAHYTVEAAYQLSVPNKSFEGIVHKNQSFFTLSFTYLFFKDK